MKAKILDSGRGDPLAYALGEHNWKGDRRRVPPQICGGSPARFRLLRGSFHDCMSLALSFEERAEELPEEKMAAFLSSAKKFVMPDVREQGTEMVSVRHVRENGSVDIHLVVPLVFMANGLSIPLLSASRGDLGHLFAFQEWANSHFGFTSPTEFHRGQVDAFVPHRLPSKSKALFKAVDQAVSRAYEDGLIHDRTGVVFFIQERGYAVTRSDDYSLTVSDATGTKVRLKGFKYQSALTRELREVERGHWNLINSLPAEKRQQHWLNVYSAALQQRRVHLDASIRASSQIGPLLLPKDELLPSASERDRLLRVPHVPALIRGLPTRLFALRLACHPGLPALSPVIVSLCHDLPQLLPNDPSQARQWAQISGSARELLHENKTIQSQKQPNPGTRRALNTGLGGDSKASGGLDTPSVTNLENRSGHEEDLLRSDGPGTKHSKDELRIEGVGRSIVSCDELAGAIKRFEAAVSDLSACGEFGSLKRQTMADLLRRGLGPVRSQPELEF